jgi:hypothetical protein
MEQNKKAGEVHHIISTVSGKRPGNYKVAECSELSSGLYCRVK